MIEIDKGWLVAYAVALLAMAMISYRIGRVDQHRWDLGACYCEPACDKAVVP